VILLALKSIQERYRLRNWRSWLRKSTNSFKSKIESQLIKRPQEIDLPGSPLKAKVCVFNTEWSMHQLVSYASTFKICCVVSSEFNLLIALNTFVRCDYNLQTIIMSHQDCETHERTCGYARHKGGRCRSYLCAPWKHSWRQRISLKTPLFTSILKNT
jgi:hypothetical protein